MRRLNGKNQREQVSDTAVREVAGGGVDLKSGWKELVVKTTKRRPTAALRAARQKAKTGRSRRVPSRSPETIIALDERDSDSSDGPHPGDGDPDRDWPDGIPIKPGKKPQPPTGTEIELAWWLSKAVIEGDINELNQFQRAVKTIKRIEETGPVNRARALAILFICRFTIETNFLPTRRVVKAALRKMNCKIQWSDNGVTDKRFWRAPIL
jgi:hypothetical protein